MIMKKTLRLPQRDTLKLSSKQKLIFRLAANSELELKQ